MASLRITEIFLSLQGESRTVGLPTVFVRLTGCPLRCHWCDTAYAFSGGQRMAIPEIMGTIRQLKTRRVCVTGGEPLAQPQVLTLLDFLVEGGYEVSLETSGALDISPVNPAVSKVVDLKAPGSGEEASNLYENILHLGSNDQVKIVIRDHQDFLWAIARVREYQLTERCEVLFSPVAGEMPPEELAHQILEEGIDVRFQLQLHKILWGEARGV